MPVVFGVIHQVLLDIVHLTLGLSCARLGELIDEYLLLEKLVAVLRRVFFGTRLLVFELRRHTEVGHGG